MTSPVGTARSTQYAVDPLFPGRWSPRAMSGEELSQEALMALFEAARWAPSSYNNQPWRFVYARRNTSAWSRFLDLLASGNREWATSAAVLVVVLSKTTFDRNGKPSRTHSFDAGAAWENLALQASSRGIVTHGMQGFDYEAARHVVEAPDGFDVEAMVAIGLPGKPEQLSPSLQEREWPSERKALEEIVFEATLRSQGNGSD